GSSIEDTFFRSISSPPTTQRLFEVPGAGHPYLSHQIMTKIFNNVTTRSNTFAVWMTVGFFEVTDETAVPPKLGAEINLTTNRNIRHRMFSIIDRSSINLLQTVAISQNAVNGGPGVGPQTVTPAPMSGLVPINGVPVPWSIQEGSLLVIDQGTPQEEFVVVTQVG